MGTATDTMWIVPGAPLEAGRGWKVWYSRAGSQPFDPAPLRISPVGSPDSFEPAQQSWDLFPPLRGVRRRFGVLTVTLDRPSPGSVYQVAVPELDETATLPFRWRSLPAALDDRGTTFLFGSCFWHDDDKGGAFASAASYLADRWEASFKLLIGDQVYQDFPPVLPTDSPNRAFAGRYAVCWGDPLFRAMLGTSPNCFMGDDHEFWNDYPEPQRHLLYTRSEESRAEWSETAQLFYQYFQRSANPGAERWYRLDVPPVSVFVADTRSERSRIADSDSRTPDPVTPHFFGEAQWAALEAWQHGLRGPGVLVLGQPLYQKDGDWKDHSLSNFREDHGRLCAVIENSLRGHNAERRPHDVLMLSGDIHTGRYALGTLSGLPGAVVPELIASPASMVTPGFGGSGHPQYPPPKFTASHAGRSTVWNVSVVETADMPTVDNNVGMVRMFPGTGGRVRFELSLWRVRPFSTRPLWGLGPRVGGQSRSPLAQIFSHELQLR